MGMTKTIRNDAILLNVIYRLGLDLDENTWWVESQKGLKMLIEPSESQNEDEEPDSNFVMAEKFSKKPIPLPTGVVFGGILTEKFGLISEGITYVHFFPNGYTEQTILYLKKEGADQVFYSMILRPLRVQ